MASVWIKHWGRWFPVGFSNECELMWREQREITQDDERNESCEIIRRKVKNVGKKKKEKKKKKEPAERKTATGRICVVQHTHKEYLWGRFLRASRVRVHCLTN